MKVKYIISVDAPKFGQELFGRMISALLSSFNQRKTYQAGILDHEIAPKYTRRSNFNYVQPKAEEQL